MSAVWQINPDGLFLRAKKEMKKFFLFLLFGCLVAGIRTARAADAATDSIPYVQAIGTNTFAGIVPQPYYLRIPFAEVTNQGTLIVGADLRERTTADQTQISIGIVRSTDKGATFTAPQVIIPHTGQSDWDRVMDGTILVNRKNGDIFVFAHRIAGKEVWEQIHQAGEHGFDCVVTRSSDDGQTWSEPFSLKEAMGSFGDNVVSLFGGVGHGITMENGTLVLPIQCKMATANTGGPTGETDSGDGLFNIQSGLLYSQDGGRTWKRSATLLPCYSSECNIVEYERGKLMINSRGYISKRRIYVTEDLGKTWRKAPADGTLVEPKACQGSFHKIRRGKETYGLFVNPRDSLVRKNLTLYKTADFRHYLPLLTLEEDETFGYSSITSDEEHVYVVLEDKGQAIRVYTLDLSIGSK